MRFLPSSLLLVAATFTTLPLHAVVVSPTQVGQVLLYPYYTVRPSALSGSLQNTLISITNTSSEGKVVKLRFREGKAGAMVFEANVFLSAWDVWTAALVATEAGATLHSNDASCTQPVRLFQSHTAGLPPDGRFVNTAYANDPLGPDIDRVREGSFEVLEMGTVRAETATVGAIDHIGGVASCKLGTDQAIMADLGPPSGALQGSAAIFSVLDGLSFSYDAVALDQWSTQAKFSAPMAGTPTLGDASPSVSATVANGNLYLSSWNSGIDAVSAVLLGNAAVVEFMREPWVNGATDIVYTLPTKPLALSMAGVRAPFKSALSANGACETTTAMTFDREERVTTFPEDGFMLYGSSALCWVTNVRSLGAVAPSPSKVVGSRNFLRYFLGDHEVSEGETGYEHGIAVLGLDDGSAIRRMPPLSTTVVNLATGEKTSAAVDYVGLPVVGAAFTRYVNGTLTVDGQPTLSNYGTTSRVRSMPAIVHR